MSPELVARAKRERWARQVNGELADLVSNLWFSIRHPVIGLYFARYRIHAALGLAPPPQPKIGVRV